MRMPLRWGRWALPVFALGLVALAGCGAGGATADAQNATVANALAASETAQPAHPAAEPVSAEAPAPAPGHGLVRVTLPIEPRTLDVAPGLTQTVWSFAGRVPGPVIRARQGDTVEVTVVNRDNIGHSIDFHAARVAPDQAFANVAPGDSKTIRFVVNDPGVFLYHCATAPMIMHMAMGMYGMIIVDPENGRAPATEFALVQSEFYKDMDMSAMAKGDAAAVVFNGKADQYKEEPLKVKVGERVRIYVVDAGPDHFSAFHVVGTVFDRVEADGNPGNVLRGVSTYTLAPGGAAVFETHFDDPGRYPFVTHSMGDVAQGAVGIIEVSK